MRQGWLFLHVCGLGSMVVQEQGLPTSAVSSSENHVAGHIRNLPYWVLLCEQEGWMSSHQRWIELPEKKRGFNAPKYSVWAWLRCAGVSCLLEIQLPAPGTHPGILSTVKGQGPSSAEGLTLLCTLNQSCKTTGEWRMQTLQCFILASQASRRSIRYLHGWLSVSHWLCHSLLQTTALNKTKWKVACIPLVTSLDTKMWLIFLSWIFPD